MADSKLNLDIVGRDRASGAFNSAGRALDKLSKKVSGIPVIGATASKALSGLAGAISPQMVAAGVGAGVAAIAAFVGHAVNQFTELAATVLNFQRVTRMSAEDSSRFVAALDDMGISAEVGANALFRLGQNSARLKALGVDTGENLKETFLNVADAIAESNSAGRQNTIVMTAFGRAGKDLLPILQQGREGIEEMFASLEGGQLLSQEDLEAAENLRLALDALGDASNDLALEVGGNAVPALTELALGLAGLTESGNEWVRSGFGRDFGQFLAQLSERANVLGLLAGHLRQTGKEALPAAAAASRWKEEIRQSAEAAEAAAKATDDFREAQEKHKDATESVSDAETSLVRAQADLNRLLEEGAVDEEAVARSRERLADATRGVTDAEDRLGDARKRLNDLLNPSATDAEDLAIRRAKAQEEIGKAERRLSTVRAAGASPTAIAEAEIALREARLELAQTDEDAADKAEDIEDARRDVADAEDALKKSKDEVKRAGDELRSAEAGDADYALKLATAREQVSDAERSLEKAHYAVRDALEAQRVKLEEVRIGRQALIDQSAGFFGAIAGPINDFANPGIMGKMQQRAPSGGSVVTVNAFGVGADEAAELIIQKIDRLQRLNNMVGP